MRSKNAFRNLAVSLLYELFILILGLIVPRYIIVSYGDSVNGLTQTINRLLMLVNMLQAGAIGASIYQMLAPVANNDYKTQSEIMYSSKKFFDKMGAIYLLIVAVCSIFFGFHLQDENLNVLEIILSFMVLALNGSLYFFFTARYDIVFSSYQKKYLLSIASFIERITYYLLLFLVIFGKLYFIYMYVALLCGGLVRVIINSIFYRKLVGKNLIKKPENKNYVIKDRSYLMLASIGDQTIEAAPTVIITTFVSLLASSVFSVYSMIYLSMKTLINSFHHAVSAIFGNLVATSKDKKIASVFDSLLYVFTMLGTFLASCCAFLFMAFIGLYSLEFEESASYFVPLLAGFIVAYVAVFSLKSVFIFVSNSYGLFKLTCKATLICGIISIAVSIVLTILFGMPYVMVGVLLYHVSTTCIYVFFFRKEVSWFRFSYKWIGRIFLLIALPSVSWFIYTLNLYPITGWLGWFISAIIFAVIVLAILLIYTLIFERKAFFSLLEYIKSIFLSKKRKSVTEEQ